MHQLQDRIMIFFLWDTVKGEANITVDYGLAKQQNKWVHLGYMQILILRSHNTQTALSKYGIYVCMALTTPLSSRDAKSIHILAPSKYKKNK